MSRKSTSKRENKRIDSKKARAAENAALRGDHVKLVRGLSYGHVDDRQPPMLDDATVPQGQRKRKKQIEYCDGRKKLGEGNKRHYYIEREETRTEKSFWDGKEYTHIYYWKECMYCRKTTHGCRPWFRWLGL